MVDLVCPHGMGKPTSCVECMLDGPVVAPPRPVTWTATDYTRTAIYSATCRGCDDPVVADVDRIRLWTASDTDIASLWLHDGCTP